jgi:hypothetical protein
MAVPLSGFVFDWIVLAAGICFAISTYSSTQLKFAEALPGIDAHLAPDWIFGGWVKSITATVPWPEEAWQRGCSRMTGSRLSVRSGDSLSP